MPKPFDPRQLERIRGWRNPPERDLTLTGLMGQLGSTFRKQARSLGPVSEVWTRLAPADLVQSTSLVSMSRGVLTVRVADAAAKFTLDRWLRDGGENQLIRACPAALLRVRLVM